MLPVVLVRCTSLACDGLGLIGLGLDAEPRPLAAYIAGRPARYVLRSDINAQILYRTYLQPEILQINN